MNQDGFARFASVENLALRARVTIEEAKAAEQAFLSPDPHSSNPENEGRRIEKVPGGYIILNAQLYRELASQCAQREQNRERVRRYRLKNQQDSHDVTVGSVTDHYIPLAPVSVSASVSVQEGECEGKPQIPEIPDQFRSEKVIEAWESFKQHRREIKRKLTNKAASMILKDLEKWGEDKWIFAINKTIKGGWQGVFEPKDYRPTSGDGWGPTPKPF